MEVTILHGQWRCQCVSRKRHFVYQAEVRIRVWGVVVKSGITTTSRSKRIVKKGEHGKTILGSCYSNPTNHRSIT